MKYLPGKSQMHLHIGTSGWGYKPWKGKFYPKGLPDRDMLRFYGEHFRTVEVNNTFRSMPEASTLKKWASSVPAEFKFVLKAPMQITHMRKLKNTVDLVSQLFDTAKVLKRRRGPVLFQLPRTMKKDIPRLREFLASLPPRSRTAFEYRHPSWLDDEVFGLLRKHRVALCIADGEDGVHVPFVATASWGYVRLRQPGYSAQQLKARMKQIREQDWREAYVFFKHEDEGKGPVFAKQFIKLAARS